MVKRRLTIFALGLLFFSLTSSSVLAGGGAVYNWSWANSDGWKTGSKVIFVKSHLAPGVQCAGTTVSFRYENPENGDVVNSPSVPENGTKYSKFNGSTMPDCKVTAKFYSTNDKEKIGIVEFKTADGKVDEVRQFVLNFQLSYPPETNEQEKYPLPWEEDYIKHNQSPAPTVAPIGNVIEMVYPQDGQVLDLEGGYMFKVKHIEEASGYLFDLFQDGKLVYENYRDGGQLSLNGEFALWDADPVHANFHAGNLVVTMRALVKGQWTDTRTINLILKPRGKTLESSKSASKLQPVVISPTQMSSAATDSSALQKRIDELQKKLEESQQRQSALEGRLNQIIEWIKSIFPFFK